MKLANKPLNKRLRILFEALNKVKTVSNNDVFIDTQLAVIADSIQSIYEYVYPEVHGI